MIPSPRPQRALFETLFLSLICFHSIGLSAELSAGPPRSLTVSADIANVNTLKQNWTDAEGSWFYSVPQGSRLIPYDRFLNLEQVDSQAKFRDMEHMRTLRTGEAQDQQPASGSARRSGSRKRGPWSLGFYQSPELTPEQAAAEAPYGHGDLFMQGYYDVGDKMVVANEVAMLIGDAVTGGGLKICKAGKVLKWGVYGVRALQVAGSSYQAYNNFSNGNYAAGGLNVLQAIVGIIGFRGPCFAAGTPLLTPTGEKRIEDFQPGDWILSAPENDPAAPVEAKYVEEVFESRAVLWNLHVGGQVIQTTAAHPFWVKGKGWARARELKPGDLLRGHDGRWTPVEELFDTGEEVPVYNLQIAAERKGKEKGKEKVSGPFNLDN